MEEITQLEVAKEETQIKAIHFFWSLIGFLASIVSSRIWMDWPGSIVVSILILAHECGHFIEARRLGIKVSLPYFIPFCGAFVIKPNQWIGVQDEMRLVIGGPLYGSLATALAFVIWLGWFSHCSGVATGIFVSIFINILNLMPVRSLDGGRIDHLTKFMGKEKLRWWLASMLLLSFLGALGVA